MKEIFHAKKIVLLTSQRIPLYLKLSALIWMIDSFLNTI